MRQICLVLLVCSLLVLGVGCSSNEYKAPEGVRQQFYNDMVQCLKYAEKTLETKNTKYIDEIEKLIEKYTSENFFEVVLGIQEENKQIEGDYGLSSQESEILTSVFGLWFALSQYMQEYFKNDYDVNKMIDTNSINGKILLKSIQEVISVMKLDYQFKY